MKRAGVGIASVLAGLTVVFSTVPAHAMFMYLNSAPNHPALGAPRGTAKVKVAQTGSASVVRTQDEDQSANATAGLVDSGMQQFAVSDESEAGAVEYYSTTARFNHSRFNYSWDPRQGSLFGSVLHEYRSTGGTQQPLANAPVPAKSGPPVGTSPAVGVTVPPSTDLIDEVVSPPVTEVPSAPVWNNPPPVVAQPVTGDIRPDDTDIIGVPTHTVPDPSTVGLLGIGLLLTFFANARRSRARFNAQARLNA